MNNTSSRFSVSSKSVISLCDSVCFLSFNTVALILLPGCSNDILCATAFSVVALYWTWPKSE